MRSRRPASLACVPAPASTDIVDTKTSRARKLVSTPIGELPVVAERREDRLRSAAEPAGEAVALPRLDLERVGLVRQRARSVGRVPGAAPARAAPTASAGGALRGYALSHHITMQIAMMTVPAVLRNARP